jgi:predicted nucleic acid-binding protein
VEPLRRKQFWTSEKRAGAELKAALDRLAVVREGWREILPSDKLRNQAEDLLDTYALRAADSLQLASALIWCQQRAQDRKFISTDHRLCDAARRVGFAVISPAALS